MSGIAGIAEEGGHDIINRMLDKISHRGSAGRAIIDDESGTFGVNWSNSLKDSLNDMKREKYVCDKRGNDHSAEAKIVNGKLILMRDPLGVAPLYYGWSQNGALCFASEVKAMLEITRDIYQVLPGHRYEDNSLQTYFHLQKQRPLNEQPDVIANELRRRLEAAVKKSIIMDEMGSWLSGGLDSSTMAALARHRVTTLHTFVAGLSGAPDLEYAREVANYIQSKHHEAVVSLEEMLAVLPQVIYHLESFDALLVRSSITNYLVAKLASDYVSDVFSGEGGDELFAGYDYLKSIDPNLLPDELIDITNRLHNTALQRVDRSASAHGTVAHVGFLDPDVVDFALRIPIEYKLHNGVEKWILRRAMDGLVPEQILNRTKAKFWEGAGVGELLANYADKHITQLDFSQERVLSNGWELSSKEELMYYRIFHEHFGDLNKLSWMGRTKGSTDQ